MIIKNSNLRMILHTNRYKIMAVIIAIILILGVIYWTNDKIKNTPSMKNETSSKENIGYPIEQSVITEDKVPEEKQKKNTQIIDDFISYCNTNQIDKAYSLLSTECQKKVFFSDEEYFSKNYIHKIFTNKKTYSIQSWITDIGYTYRVQMMEDTLATGNVNSKITQDYYTIVQEDGQTKLNINGFIGNEKLKKTAENEKISIQVIDRDIYIDYEIYHFTITNKTNKTININNGERTDAIYLISENDKKYTAYSYEITQVKSHINARQTQNVDIKFNKRYATRVQMKKIIFEDIILDSNGYETMDEQQKIDTKLTTIIEL